MRGHKRKVCKADDIRLIVKSTNLGSRYKRCIRN